MKRRVKGMHGYIWGSHSQVISLFEGNLSNFEGKFIIKMDICVFFLQKILKMCKTFHIFDANLDHIPGKFCIFSSLGDTLTEIYTSKNNTMMSDLHQDY